jgi:hypothetical protein
MKVAQCHPTRKEQARGMCKNCYDKWLKETNPVYKQKQLSNSAIWARKNPEKAKQYGRQRIEKEKNDVVAKAKKKNQMLKRKYGITLEQYNVLLQNQKNKCALCYRSQGKTALHVDHDHKTLKVRGLLCHQCNWYLGVIDADTNILKRIEEYIK